MSEFLRKYRHLVAGLVILLIALQIPIYWKQDRSLGLPARFLYTLAHYPQLGWVLATRSVGNVVSGYLALVGVEKENQQLREQNARLANELAHLTEASRENERLEALLEMGRRNAFKAIGARVIALDASSWFRSFTIDVGADHGITRGMAVITHEGLVGTVVSISSTSSKVLPIVDVHSSVEVISARSRTRGILVGRGRDRAYLNYVERNEDMRQGDVLITSGLTRMFPAGLPVAIVQEVRQKSYGLFQEAYADVIVPIHRLENVLVLRYEEGQPIPPYQPPSTAPSLLATFAATGPTLAATPGPTSPAVPERSATERRQRELLGATLPLAPTPEPRQPVAHPSAPVVSSPDAPPRPDPQQSSAAAPATRAPQRTPVTQRTPTPDGPAASAATPAAHPTPPPSLPPETGSTDASTPAAMLPALPSAMPNRSPAPSDAKPVAAPVTEVTP